MRVSRATTLGSGMFVIGVALLIAELATSVGGTVLESSGIWMSLLLVLAPVFLIGVTSLRARELHALTAIAAGSVVTVLTIAWYYRVKQSYGEAGFHMAAVAAFLATGAVGYGLSFLAPRCKPEELANLTLWTLRRETNP